MRDEAERLRDPGFRKLLSERSRWRWGLSIFIVGAYFIYIVAGTYIPDVYAVPFMGSSVPWGVMIGWLIIALSIVLSLVYVRAVDKLKYEESGRQEPEQ